MILLKSALKSLIGLNLVETDILIYNNGVIDIILKK
jgi:hypothetical protein